MNKKLIAGIILVSLFFLIAIFGSWLAPYSLDDREKTHYNYDDGSLSAPPLPPSSDHLLGTDKNGYDMLTKLLNGAKFTIITSSVIAFFRILIGAIIGIMLGIRSERRGKTILGIAWGAIPTFLIVYVLLKPINIQFETKELSYKLLAITIIIFILVGLPSIVANFRDRTRIIMKNEYINAAKILGASPTSIMRKHIFPHLKESVITLFVTEIVLILTLYGQLGLFNIFIGGTVMYFDPPDYYSISNEWAGLIGQYRMFIYSKQWIVLGPIFSFLMLILSFQLLSDGLRDYYKKKLNSNSFI